MFILYYCSSFNVVTSLLYSRLLVEVPVVLATSRQDQLFERNSLICCYVLSYKYAVGTGVLIMPNIEV